MNPEPGQTEKKIWFPAKRYGWGWGPPNCWQGWVVVMIYIGLAAGGAIWMNAGEHPIRFSLYLVAITIALCFVCWLKGEKPRWRWGGK